MAGYNHCRDGMNRWSGPACTAASISQRHLFAVFIFLRNRSLYTNGHTGYAKNGDVRILYLEIPRYYRYIVEFNRVISQNGFLQLKWRLYPQLTSRLCASGRHTSLSSSCMVIQSKYTCKNVGFHRGFEPRSCKLSTLNYAVFRKVLNSSLYTSIRTIDSHVVITLYVACT